MIDMIEINIQDLWHLRRLREVESCFVELHVHPPIFFPYSVAVLLVVFPFRWREDTR